MEKISDIFYVFMIYAIIGVLWAIAEQLIYGRTFPNIGDDFIALGLAIIIYSVWKWMA